DDLFERAYPVLEPPEVLYVLLEGVDGDLLLHLAVEFLYAIGHELFQLFRVALAHIEKRLAACLEDALRFLDPLLGVAVAVVGHLLVVCPEVSDARWHREFGHHCRLFAADRVDTGAHRYRCRYRRGRRYRPPGRRRWLRLSAGYVLHLRRGLVALG